MKLRMKLWISILLLIPASALAQDFRNMSESDMAAMMQQVQQMQSCMAKVDQDELKALDKRSQQLSGEVKSLCADGSRDQAQEKALSYGKEIARNPAMKTMTECGEILKDVMPKLPFADADSSGQHVCDTL
ncbi:MAG: hypothetical protein V7721_04690 [Porticoccaceae bacterium]